LIKGKKVAVLDDSIVRGTTSRHLVDLFKESGAEKIYFVSAAPPIRYPCVYGIDISVKSELIAANNEIDDIASYLGVDKVIYQSLDDLKDLYRSCGFCYACFSGEFPTGLSPEMLSEIESERLRSKERRSKGGGSDRRKAKGKAGRLSEQEPVPAASACGSGEASR
jgi:amidophosphoribosyltransferase